MKTSCKTFMRAQSLSDLSPEGVEVVRRMYGNSQEKGRSRLTTEALCDVDASHVIDHQAVQAWAESLDTPNPLPMLR